MLNVAQLASALVLPASIERRRDRRPALLGAVSLTVAAAVWLVVLPGVGQLAVGTRLGPHHRESVDAEGRPAAAVRS